MIDFILNIGDRILHMYNTYTTDKNEKVNVFGSVES